MLCISNFIFAGMDHKQASRKHVDSELAKKTFIASDKVQPDQNS